MMAGPLPRRDWFGQVTLDDLATKVWKFGTGHEVPPGAVYLCTVVESERDPRLVYHYFRVPVDA